MAERKEMSQKSLERPPESAADRIVVLQTACIGSAPVCTMWYVYRTQYIPGDKGLEMEHVLCAQKMI